MKKLLYLALLMIAVGLCLTYKDEIIVLYQVAVNYFTSHEKTLVKNEYYREYDFLYLQNTDNFKPLNLQELINVFYTVINSGVDSFTFHCPVEYQQCLDDIKTLANDQTTLSHINNFVHPFNAFKHIETQYNALGEVTITIDKSYTPDDIEIINKKIDELYNSLINENSSDTEKIKVIHDYIINNSKYDSGRSDYSMDTYKSDIAYGPLLQGYGVCGGYSDLMQLYLEKFGLKNYRISSENHVWNAVYLNNTWYHLDLTWDDPVTDNNTNVLQHDYFLISTNKLFSNDLKEHKFDMDIYLELKST